MYGEMKGNLVSGCIYSLFKAFYHSWNVRPQHLKTRTQVSERLPAVGPRGADLALIFKIPREILGTPTLTRKFRARRAVFKVRGPATNSFEAVGGGGGKGQIWLFSLSGGLELLD